jgi:sulfite reductase (NADPH) hemoprotein beta-component
MIVVSGRPPAANPSQPLARGRLTAKTKPAIASNGCPRPYLAEIALVGKAPGRYNLYLGASATGDRLNALFRENIAEPEILTALDSLLRRYAAERTPGERFGDFTVRTAVVPAMVNGRDFQRLPSSP